MAAQGFFQHLRILFCLAQPGSELLWPQAHLVEARCLAIVLGKLERFMSWVQIGMPRGRLPTSAANLFQTFQGPVDPDHELCQALHGRGFGKLDEETV
jgi:hypothetical protein